MLVKERFIKEMGHKEGSEAWQDWERRKAGYPKRRGPLGFTKLVLGNSE